MQAQIMVPVLALGIAIFFTPILQSDSPVEAHDAAASHAAGAAVYTGCGCGGVTLPCTNTGSALDDTWNGTTSNECYDGLSGNDTINGSGGGDCLFGGPGNDVIDGGDGGDFIKGEAGNDRLSGSGSNDCLEGGPDDDVLLGMEGDDSLIGGGQDDCLRGGPDNDYCWGSFGDDHIIGGSGADELYHHRKAPNPLWQTANGVDCLDAADGAGVDTVYAGSEDFVFIDDGDKLVLLNVDATTQAILTTLATDPLVLYSQDDYEEWRGGQSLPEMPEDCDC